MSAGYSFLVMSRRCKILLPFRVTVFSRMLMLLFSVLADLRGAFLTMGAGFIDAYVLFHGILHGELHHGGEFFVVLSHGYCCPVGCRVGNMNILAGRGRALARSARGSVTGVHG